MGRARGCIRAAHARRVPAVPARPGRADPATAFAEPTFAVAEAPVPVAGEPACASCPQRLDRGRIALVVVGTIAGLLALGLLVGGCALVAVDQTQRDDDGFLMSPTEDFSTPTYAIVSENADLGDEEPSGRSTRSSARSGFAASDRPVFVGIGPARDVTRYLGGVERDVVDDLDSDGDPEYSRRSGGAPSGQPGDETFWVASTTGAGERTLDWEPEDGDWRAVVMNEDEDARCLRRAEHRRRAGLDPVDRHRTALCRRPLRRRLRASNHCGYAQPTLTPAAGQSTSLTGSM